MSGSVRVGDGSPRHPRPLAGGLGEGQTSVRKVFGMFPKVFGPEQLQTCSDTFGPEHVRNTFETRSEYACSDSIHTGLQDCLVESAQCESNN